MPKKADTDGAHESKSSSTQPPAMGVEALYLPVVTPDNSESTLQFQWMRLHPLTVVALSDATTTNPTASEAATHAAKMFPRYRRAAAASSKFGDGVPNVAERGAHLSTQSVVSDSFMSPFLRASGVGVDLADLIEPPLLSTSVPKFSDEENDGTVKRQCLNDASGIDEVGVRIKEGLREVALSAFSEIESQYTSETTELHLNCISSLTASELRTSLSSIFFKSVLMKTYGQRVQDRPFTGTAAEFFIVSLVLLAKFGANEKIGRHILQVLAPPVLVDCSDLVTDPKFSDVGTRLFHRLAQALVVNCSLGGLSKRELLNLMPALDGTDDNASDALRELFCCLGEAFAVARRA